MTNWLTSLHAFWISVPASTLVETTPVKQCNTCNTIQCNSTLLPNLVPYWRQLPLNSAIHVIQIQVQFNYIAKFSTLLETTPVKQCNTCNTIQCNSTLLPNLVPYWRQLPLNSAIHVIQYNALHFIAKFQGYCTLNVSVCQVHSLTHPGQSECRDKVILEQQN